MWPLLKIGDSIKGKKSFGVMNYETPYMRPSWPVLSNVEGYVVVRGLVATFKSSLVYSIGSSYYSFFSSYLYNPNSVLLAVIINSFPLFEYSYSPPNIKFQSKFAVQ